MAAARILCRLSRSKLNLALWALKQQGNLIWQSGDKLRLTGITHHSKPVADNNCIRCFSKLLFSGSDRLSDNRGNDNRNSSPNPDKNTRDTDRSLKLMNFQQLIWPNPLKAVRNMFFSFMIRGYFDDGFSAATFMAGCEQAVAGVSHIISEGRFSDLNGLVAKEAIGEIQQNYELLDSDQRAFVAVNTADIFFKFIHEIGIIFDEKSEQRYVEVTTVLQGFHGLKAARDRNPQQYMIEISKSEENVYVCNYRFIHEYTKGKQDSWIINKLNHFSPKEVVIRGSIFK